jgi:hypothetical protein
MCSASHLVRKRLAASCKPYSEKPQCVRKRAKACVRAGLSERVGFHALEALHGLGEQGIIEQAGAFKMSMQLGRLPWVHRAVAGRG